MSFFTTLHLPNYRSINYHIVLFPYLKIKLNVKKCLYEHTGYIDIPFPN